jgi:hypothetical protein
VIADVVADQLCAAQPARIQPAVEIAGADVVPIGLRMAKQAEQLGQVRSSSLWRTGIERQRIPRAPDNTGCESL